MKVALVCIAKDEDYYLEEWLEYNHKLGFDHIFIYENNWRCSIEKDYLTKIPFDGEVMQLPAYNSFIQNNRDYDWAAFIDCDEFITLKKHKNIKELINDYQKFSGLALNWYFFGSGGKEKREFNSLLKQFKYRAEKVDRHIKVLMNLRQKFKMTLPHCANVSVVDTNMKPVSGPFNNNGPTDIAYINHYYHKTLEDFKLRCQRGRADCRLFSNLEDWENQKLDNIDVLDKFALNFMYE